MRNSTISAKASNRLMRIGIALAVFILMLTAIPDTYGQSYCQPYNYYGSNGYIANVQFNGINNSSSYIYYGCYQDFSYIVSAGCNPGKSYSLVLALRSSWSSYSGLSVWVDWNNNGSFYDAGDNVVNTGSSPINGYNTNYTTSISIPAGASTGNHRMRIGFGGYWYYWYYYGGYNDPCWSYWYYCEHEDYTLKVAPPPNDAAITQIPGPVDYFRFTDPQMVTATLQNVSKWQLQSAEIRWWIDGVQQATKFWTGALDSGATANVDLGSVTFNPQAPWNPFQLRVEVFNPRGPDAAANAAGDGNPNNNFKTRDVNCILNDAGFVDADIMIPITPGVNPVWLNIKNYAPKPLSTTRINWKVNYVNMTPYDFVGTINYNNTEYVNVGSYNFFGGNIPYNIWASTSIPNGITDEFPANDSGSVEVYKALPGGRYTIGAYNADFKTLVEAVDFINYWGYAGPLELMFRPGSYQAGVQIKPRGSRTFPITFGSVTGSSYDVNLFYSASGPGDNFLFKFDGLDNITFKDITLNATGSQYGTILEFLNGNDNVTIQNCVFNGINNYSCDMDAAVVKSDRNVISMFNITNNTFNGGSIVLYLYSPDYTFSNQVMIKGNSFSNFCYTGIDVSNFYGMHIHENNFYGSNFNYGIRAYNCSEIKDNRINGFNGWDWNGYYDITAPVAGICVIHDNPSAEAPVITGNTVAGTDAHGIFVQGVNSAEISNNVFNITSNYNQRAALMLNNSYGGGGGLTFAASSAILVEKNIFVAYGAYGIYNNGYEADILYNKFTIEGGSAGIFGIYDAGTIADNMVACRGGEAASFMYSNSNAYYNTFYTNSNGPAVSLNYPYGGSFLRNMYYNAGMGYAVMGWDIANLNSDQNNIFTKGGDLGEYNGSVTTTLADWQSATGKDASSVSEEAFFMTETDLKLVQVNENLYRTDLLGIGDEIELKDFAGNSRAELQYFGAHTILPGINIVDQPQQIVNCFGATGQMFFVVSTIDYGGSITYQWQKDGVDIPGATNAILNFPALDFAMDGVYRCIINGNAGAHQVITKDVLLYTLRVTEITREPEDNMLDLGETAKFDLDVHVYESIPQGYKPQVQWYRDDVPLKDNDRISGAKSSILTIRDITPTDYYDNYRVVITGLCGADTSRAISIMARPKINVKTQPDTLVELCEGMPAQFVIDAEVNMPNMKINYRWRLNGVEIDDDGHYMGARTATLLIDKVRSGDAGNYDCLIYLDKNVDVVNTVVTVLSVKLLPSIVTHPAAVLTVKKDQELRIEFEAQGHQPLMYAWFKDGQPVGDSNAVLVKAQASPTDGGLYICKVWNECGEIWTKECDVVITTAIMMDVIDGLTEFTVMQNQPNPFNALTQVSIYAPANADAQISVTDIYGREIKAFGLRLAEGFNSVSFNGSNLTDGVYYFNMTVNGVKSTLKMIVVK